MLNLAGATIHGYIMNSNSELQNGWPEWPQFTSDMAAEVASVLAGGRWAISGFWNGVPSRERQFSKAFAAWHGVPFCTPTVNGSSALVVALEALNIGFLDEVIVPGLTWVASASAILRVNAVPVLVDIDPETLCISPEAIEAAITSRTRAICVVHLYSCMADIDAIGLIAKRYGIPILEDCAQAHGSVWKGRMAGTFGAVGTFSFQQGKVLTSGEGGAAITSDARLSHRMEQLRADGRVFGRTARPGELELVEVGDVQGANFCLSEIASALLQVGLTMLEPQNRARETAARKLDEALRDIPGVRAIQCDERQDRRTYYQYCIRLDRKKSGMTASDFARRLSRELNFPVGTAYPPLNRNPLYCPSTKKSNALGPEYEIAVAPGRFSLPASESAAQECITLHHRILLSTEAQLGTLIDGVRRAIGVA